MYVQLPCLPTNWVPTDVRKILCGRNCKQSCQTKEIEREKIRKTMLCTGRESNKRHKERQENRREIDTQSKDPHMQGDDKSAHQHTNLDGF